MTRCTRIVAFKQWHAAALPLRPETAAALGGAWPSPELARRYQEAGQAWTLFDLGHIAACGGVVRFWPGVGELWCWTGRGADDRPISFARHAREQVDELLRGHGFHRLQAHVRADDARARRFALFLGLAFEGECPGYGPDGAAYQLYGRVQWKQ